MAGEDIGHFCAEGVVYRALCYQGAAHFTGESAWY
jgi:hypothetical protein